MFRRNIEGVVNFPLFIHIPKTGGTYLRTCFKKKKIFSICNVLHTPIKFTRYKKENNFSFAVVRNPYERFYSACKFSGYNNPIHIENISNKLVEGGIDWISDYSILHFEHFFTQKHYVVNIEGEVIVDLIGKYEDLPEFVEMLKVNNIDITQEFELKVNTSFEWKNILTDKTISNINKIYKEDFEEFNYKMIG